MVGHAGRDLDAWRSHPHSGPRQGDTAVAFGVREHSEYAYPPEAETAENLLLYRLRVTAPEPLEISCEPPGGGVLGHQSGPDPDGWTTLVE